MTNIIAFPGRLAEARLNQGIDDAVAEVIFDQNDVSLATKNDLRVEVADVQADIANVRTDIATAKNDLKEEIRAEIAASGNSVKEELRAEISRVDKKLTMPPPILKAR